MAQQTVEEGKLDRRLSSQYFPAGITAVSLEIKFEKYRTYKHTKRNYFP
jgi:hypothetical protein